MTAVSGKKNGQDFSGSYSYDKAGNPTSYFNPGDLSTWTLSWKNGRELGKAVKSGTTLSFDYDVNGLRTWKNVGGTKREYTYGSGQLLRETYSQGGTDYTLDFLYDLNNRPYMLYLTTKTGSTTTSRPYYYILNLQGDVVHLVNTAGKAMASYTYDPYGAILTKSGEFADLNPIRYRGYYYDTETGFYYLQSRYYDPALGRFINADSYASTGQEYIGYNMFAYCGNNPVTRDDRDGKLWNFVVGAVVGAVVGVISTVVNEVADKGLSALGDGKTWAKAGVSAVTGAIGGTIAASGIGLAGSVAWGGVLGGTESTFHQLIDDGKVDLTKVGVAVACGAIGGLSGGKGAVRGDKIMKKQCGRFWAHRKTDGLKKAAHFLKRMTWNYSKNCGYGKSAAFSVFKGSIGANGASRFFRHVVEPLI